MIRVRRAPAVQRVGSRLARDQPKGNPALDITFEGARALQVTGRQRRAHQLGPELLLIGGTRFTLQPPITFSPRVDRADKIADLAQGIGPQRFGGSGHLGIDHGDGQAFEHRIGPAFGGGDPGIQQLQIRQLFRRDRLVEDGIDACLGLFQIANIEGRFGRGQFRAAAHRWRRAAQWHGRCRAGWRLGLRQGLHRRRPSGLRRLRSRRRRADAAGQQSKPRSESDERRQRPCFTLVLRRSHGLKSMTRCLRAADHPAAAINRQQTFEHVES